jgi:hypothetical protein
MLQKYNAGSIELCGEDYPAEVAFEFDESGIVIHAICAIKVLAKADEIYYDRHGKYFVGPYSISLDITRFLSPAQIKAWEEEITAYYEWLNAENQAA